MAWMLWDFLVFILPSSHSLDLSTQHCQARSTGCPSFTVYEINKGEGDTVPSITRESPSHPMAAQGTLMEQTNE